MVENWQCSPLCQDLAPVPLTVFRSNSKFDQNVQYSGLKRTLLITTKCCTRHDSVTVVTCTKCCCDRLNVFPNFERILNSLEIPLVGWRENLNNRWFSKLWQQNHIIGDKTVQLPAACLKTLTIECFLLKFRKTFDIWSVSKPRMSLNNVERMYGIFLWIPCWQIVIWMTRTHAPVEMSADIRVQYAINDIIFEFIDGNLMFRSSVTKPYDGCSMLEWLINSCSCICTDGWNGWRDSLCENILQYADVMLVSQFKYQAFLMGLFTVGERNVAKIYYASIFNTRMILPYKSMHILIKKFNTFLWKALWSAWFSKCLYPENPFNNQFKGMFLVTMRMYFYNTFIKTSSRVNVWCDGLYSALQSKRKVIFHLKHGRYGVMLDGTTCEIHGMIGFDLRRIFQRRPQ